MEKIIADLRVTAKVTKVTKEYRLPSVNSTIQVVDFSATPDDPFYAKTKSLLLRRGTAAIYSKDGTLLTLLTLLCGSPKFGYEEDQLTLAPDYSSLKLEETVFTTKENGEAGHLTYVQLNGAWLAVVGSKNVHIVLACGAATSADLAFYEGLNEMRLTQAIANARLLMEHCSFVFSNVKMMDYLYKTNQTIVFEAIFNNHLVHYDKHTVRAFAITQPQIESVDRQGLCRPPRSAFKLLRSWGFETPECHAALTSGHRYAESVQRLKRSYSNMKNSEGAVVYEVYINTVTKEKIVAKIYKHKNNEYIVQRAAREQIANGASIDGWERRMRTLHIIDEPNIRQRVRYLLAFYVWYKIHILKDSSKKYDPRSDFMTLLNKFDAVVASDADGDAIVDKLVERAREVLASDKAKNDKVLAIMFVGMQGSGKSSLRLALLGMLAKATYANQDELGGNRKAFINKLDGVKKANVIIVDKCNHLARLRDDVYERFSRVLIVEITSTKELCLRRIRSRGMSHQTLLPCGAEKVLDQCSDAMEPITDEERASHNWIKLDALKPVESNAREIVRRVLELDPTIEVQRSPTLVKDALASYKEGVAAATLKRVLFWRARAVDKSVEQINEALDALTALTFDSSIRMKMEMSDEHQHEYHLTLIFGENPAYLERVLPLFNKTIIVVISSVAFDDRAAALVVEKTDEIASICTNEHPHITVGFADGVSASYANDMMAGKHSTVALTKPLHLRMLVEPVLKKK